MFLPLQQKNKAVNNSKSSGAKHFQTVIAAFVCFHCPLVTSAEAIPHATRKAKPQIAPKVAAPKGSRGRSESPLVASAEAKSLHNNTEIG